MTDTTNDIVALLSLLERGGWERYRAALTALVAERDALKQERDDARREVCREAAMRSAMLGAYRNSHQHAVDRGWDCYKEWGWA